MSYRAVCDDDPVVSWVSSHSSQTLPEAHDDLSVVNHDAVADAPSSVIPVSDSSCDPVVSSDFSNRYTSRLGRVIRPVCRVGPS